MASSVNNIRRAYGTRNPLQKVFPGPVVSSRAPRTTDLAQIGTLWVHTSSNDIYALTSVVANVATWELLTPAAVVAIQTLTGDTGGAIAPVSGNVDILGAQGFAFDGTAGTLTISYDSIQLPATDSGFTAGYIAINGNTVMHTLQGGGGAQNLFLGNPATAPGAITSATRNFSIGNNTLAAITSGGDNIAFGSGTSTSLGVGAGAAITIGQRNILIGGAAGKGITIGDDNIVLGVNAGFNVTTTSSNNIVIGNAVDGQAADNSIYLGNASTHTRCFVAGVVGVTTGVNDAIPVLVDSAGQFGTASSSLRYKNNVRKMADYSDDIHDLNPVIFNYKTNAPDSLSFGLIAEEVDEVMPALVVKKDGQAETVKYLDLIPMLLNEVQKLKKEIEALKKNRK